MNQLSNLNATIIKEVRHDATLQPSATTLNFTVENCHVNAYVFQIIINLDSPQANFLTDFNCYLLDRGNGYTGSINGYNPTTYASIGTSVSVYPSTAASPQAIVQNGTIYTIDVFQAVQDSEGLGNIYIKLTNSLTFSTSFTMTVVYKPEITYNSKLNLRNQISDSAPARVLSQTGTDLFSLSTTVMTSQSHIIANRYNHRDNIENVSYGFNVDGANPYFFFGTPYPTERWYLGFSSDCTPKIGLVTFAYYNGSNYSGFLTTQVNNGANGPGTYQFSHDGTIIFSAPSAWQAVKMDRDPRTVYNTTMVGLGTLATNNLLPNPPMYWIRCQVGFTGIATLRVSAVAPLISPTLPLTYRRKLIPPKA